MEKREANERIKRTDAGKNKKDVRPDGKKKDAGRAGVPERKQKSLCPVSKKCGGCQLLDMPYSQQLTLKKKQLEETLNSHFITEIRFMRCLTATAEEILFPGFIRKIPIS